MKEKNETIFSLARLWRKYEIYSLKKYFKDKNVLPR